MARILTLTANPAVDVSTSVERIEPVAKLRCRPERREAGGGGINVARVACRLGADAIVVFAAGGAIGRLLQHPPSGEAGKLLATYLALVRGENTGREIKNYPGSPAIAQG